MELFLTADKRVRVLVDSQFTLQQLRTRKGGKHAGEEYWADLGFYSRMDEAISGALRKAREPWAAENGFLTSLSDLANVLAFHERMRSVVYHLGIAVADFPQPSETARLEGVVVGDLRDNPWR